MESGTDEASAGDPKTPEEKRIVIESHSNYDNVLNYLVVALLLLVGFQSYRQWRAELRAEQRARVIDNDSAIIRSLSDTVDAFRELVTAKTPEEQEAARERLRQLEAEAQAKRQSLVPNATTQTSKPRGASTTVGESNPPTTKQSAPPPTTSSRSPPPSSTTTTTTRPPPTSILPIPELPCIGGICPP